MDFQDPQLTEELPNDIITVKYTSQGKHTWEVASKLICVMTHQVKFN